MKKTLLLVVDLGTSFIKSGAYNENGECIAITSEQVKDHRPAPGVFIQKGDELFASVLSCIKLTCEKLGDRVRDIEAISFTGQMAGSIGVGKNWEDVTHWLCSADGRANSITEKMLSQHGELFLKEAGTSSPVMAPKIKWFEKDYPEETKKIAKYMVISGYIIGLLGEMDINDAVIDRTYLEWTGLSDVVHDRWSNNLLDVLAVSSDILPRIVNSNTICAYLSEKYAKICGLTAGIPLISGAGDKPAGCVGAGIVDTGDMIFEAASFGAVTACVDGYNPDVQTHRIECVPSAIAGEFLGLYYIVGSGLTLDWFVNNIAMYPGADKKQLFREMESLAAAIQPGSDGVMAFGHLGGSAMPLDGSLKGGFLGYTWTHNKGHLYRALLESYAYEFAYSIQRIKELYPNDGYKDIKVIGGGAKSELWTQMNSDVIMMPYKKLHREDIALWGGAILAGNAIGLFKDIKETSKQHIKVIKEYQPREDMHEQYSKYQKLYLEFITSLHGHFEKMLKL